MVVGDGIVEVVDGGDGIDIVVDDGVDVVVVDDVGGDAPPCGGMIDGGPQVLSVLDTR